MEVRYLIIARYAEFAQDGNLNIIGGDYDQLVGESYPHVHTVIVAATKVVFSKEDTESEHPFRAVIVDEESDEVIAEGPQGTYPKIPFPEGANHKLGSGLVLPFSNVIFPKEGRYVIKLFVDEVLMAKAAFRMAPMSYYQKLAMNMREAFSKQG